MTRFAFNIKTRSGQRVDNICIMAGNRQDAERRLRQMYHHCEIIGYHAALVNRGIEDLIGILSNGPATIPAVMRSILRYKSGAH